MASELDPDTLKKVKKTVDLEARLAVTECLWRAGLYGTSQLIDDWREIMALTRELIPMVPEGKDPQELKRFIAKYLRKIRYYTKAREIEVKEMLQEGLENAGLSESITIIKVEQVSNDDTGGD